MKSYRLAEIFSSEQGGRSDADCYFVENFRQSVGKRRVKTGG